MSEKIDLSAGYMVEFRVVARSDGQPDLMEAFQYLAEVVGASPHWLTYHHTPEYEVRSIESRPAYVMKIWVSGNALNLLKWRDVETESVRVIEDSAPTESDILTIRRENGFELSGS